jgi:hypothetical protein
MKESYRESNNKSSSKILKDGRWAMRSKEERIAISQSCLSVIQPQGRGSEDLWWRIGAMLHSELPNEDGGNGRSKMTSTPTTGKTAKIHVLPAGRLVLRLVAG